jgi:hypothetical protein
MSRNVVKFFLPYGIIVLYRQYKEYLKCTKTQKELIFDIILSVGIACRPAHYLKKHNLRICANPLDWMMSYSLDTVIHLYKTKFNDFFVNFVEDKQKSSEYNCLWYIDNKNNIISMHYNDLESDNKMFRDKMATRFKKINSILSDANKICFISNRSENIDTSCPIKRYGERMSNKLELIEYEFNDIHPQGGNLKINASAWLGNYAIWDNIMKEMSVKYKFGFLSYLFRKHKT